VSVTRKEPAFFFDKQKAPARKDQRRLLKQLQCYQAIATKDLLTMTSYHNSHLENNRAGLLIKVFSGQGEWAYVIRGLGDSLLAYDFGALPDSNFTKQPPALFALSRVERRLAAEFPGAQIASIRFRPLLADSKQGRHAA
jgi:hypothetical protein